MISIAAILIALDLVMTPPTHHHPGRSAAEGAARRFHAVLDTHFLGSDPALAVSAIAKLEKGTKTPN